MRAAQIPVGAVLLIDLQVGRAEIDGAALYRAGKYDEARDAFMAALASSPNNGWALFGLAETEKAQKRGAQAAAAMVALDRSWSGDRRWLKMDRL